MINASMSKTGIICGLSALALIACGGGGGSGGGSENSTPNSPPTISGTPPASIKPGQDYSFTPSASDADGDALTFDIENQPLWLNFDESTGQLSGVPVISDLGVYADVRIQVSDGQSQVALSPFSVSVTPPQLNENDIVTEGTVTAFDTGNPNTTGFVSEGDLEVNFGERQQRFENSTLQLEFDEEGNLLDLFGETDLPPALSDNVALNGSARATVGLFSGAEINADPDFGITLKDDFEYFVFYIGVATELEIGDRNDPSNTSTLNLELPLGGEILFILDPYDPMFYRYGSQALIGEYGYGESDNGFLPFIPIEDFDQLDSFDGHILETGSFSVGYRIVDFLEFSGTRVIHQPEFSEIDWQDPLASSIEYKAGINGEASFALSVLSVGIFDFSLATASTTLDVGFDRQHAAMQITVAPDVSWQPDWFPILPESEIVGNWSIDGSGEFSALLSGSYESVIPPASINGAMQINNDGVTLRSEIPHDTFPLTLSMAFENNTTTAQIETPDISVDGLIDDAVNEGFDRAIDEVNQAFEDLENAIGNYEVALSLDGLRSQLPIIADTVIGILNAVPGQVYDSVRSGTISALRNTCRTIIPATPISPAVRACASDFVNETSIGTSVGNAARDTAENRIAPYLSRLENLRAQAEEVQDGPAFRTALKSAILEALNNRNLSIRLRYTRTVDFGPFNVTVTLFDSTLNYQLFNNSTASMLQIAADNVDDIDPAFTVMVDTQLIFDNLPSEDDINQVRDDVQDDIVDLPTFSGAGFTVTGGTLTTFLILNDENVEVGEVNPLDPTSLFGAIGDALADWVL